MNQLLPEAGQMFKALWDQSESRRGWPFNYLEYFLESMLLLLYACCWFFFVLSLY